MKDSPVRQVTRSPGGSALTSFSWLGAGVLASRLLQSVTIIYLTRVLGDAGLGRFSFVQSFLLYGLIVAEFRFWVVGARQVAREPGALPWLATNIVTIRLLICGLEMLIIATVLPMLGVDDELYWLFVFSFLSVLAYAINSDWIFRGFERMEYVALWEALPRVVWLVGVLLLVHGRDDLLRVPLLRFAGEALTTLVLLVAAWRAYPGSRLSFAAVRVERIRSLIRQAAPLVGAALLVQVYYGFDVIVLWLMRGEAEAGQYRAAYTIVMLLMMGSFLLDATYQPILARHHATDRDGFGWHLGRLTGAALLLGTTLPAAVAIGAVPIVRVLFGSEYAPSAGVLAVLMGSLPFAYMGIAWGTALIAAGRQKLLLVASAAGAATNVVGNLVLIPLLGMTGAAIAAIVAFAVMAGLQWHYVNRTVCPVPLVPVRAAVGLVRGIPRLLGRLGGAR